MQPQNPQPPIKPEAPAPQPTNYIAPAPEYYVPQEFQRIPTGQAHPPRSKKKWVIIGILVVLILGACGFTSYFLMTHSNSNNSSKNTPALKEVPSPREIIANYEKANIASRNSLYTQRKEVTNSQITEPQPGKTVEIGPSNGVIIYQPDGTYGTAISVSERVQYARKDTVKTNDDALESETRAFLENTGFIEQHSATLGSEATLTTYDSENVICQISDNASLGTSPATYGLACVDKATIAAQYETINDVLPLAKDIDRSLITDVTIATTAQDSMKLLTLTVSLKDSASTLYFATLGTDWEYLGMRPITNPDDPNGFTLPADLKAAIQDPKWGDFLTNNIR